MQALSYVSIFLTNFQLCTELGLCSSNVQEYDDLPEDGLPEDIDYDSIEEELENRPYCPMCEYLVGELDRYMTDNRTEEYIQETVEQICDMLRYVSNKSVLILPHL